MKSLQRVIRSNEPQREAPGTLRRAGARLLQKTVALGLLGLIAFGLNVHVLILQVYGWSAMAVEYQRESGSWVDAAERTFSGETQCRVCRQISDSLLLPDDPGRAAPAGETIHLAWLFVLPVKAGTPVPPAPPVAPETLTFFLTEPGELSFAPQAPPPRMAAV